MYHSNEGNETKYVLVQHKYLSVVIIRSDKGPTQTKTLDGPEILCIN